MWGDALLDRTVLVVGAGTQPSADPEAPAGNGRAISVAAARAGATVVCADQDATAAETTAKLIREEGGTAHVTIGDVVEPDACRRIVEEATAFAGDGLLGGLVLNVGVGRGLGLEGTTVEDWDVAAAVNLRSHFLMAQTALPRMAQGSGMVFVGSVAGLRPGSGSPSYDATKAGQLGLMRHVAIEAARRQVRANLLAPGLIDTPLGRTASRHRPARDRIPVPLGRQGSAWEVADAALFLLSDFASYVTGHVLVVDGGLSIR